MTSIWEFLLQTLSVTLVALLLLVVKAIFRDKLSPRWQYGVWVVLALRCVLPAPVTRSLFLPLSLWTETWKALAEPYMTSAFSGAFAPLSLYHPLPWVTEMPRSLTDWLFVIYAAGVLLWILYYGLSWLRLRRLLKGGTAPDAGVRAQVQALCQELDIKMPRLVQVEGLPSAFVCGVFRPVLALPESHVDEKILLHELLHLKHCDALQSVLWAMLRALHWCNPVLQYVFNRVGNDMESLCDQRVLERLEGEDRRQYGVILLSMVNTSYPGAPGTTSISNGAKNIARRIDAIVRFKKYPRGMGLVSLCIVVMLAAPALIPTAYAWQDSVFRPGPVEELPQAMAASRLRRCETMAGAADTYAKGLLYANGVYVAMASPLERQEELYNKMVYHGQIEGWVSYHLDPGQYLDSPDPSAGYYLLNLRRTGEDSHEALLALGVYYFLDPETGNPILSPEQGFQQGFVTIPISITRENDGYVVRETGARRQHFAALSELTHAAPDPTWCRNLRAEGKSGTVTLQTYTLHTVKNTGNTGLFGNTTGVSDTLTTDAELNFGYSYGSGNYLCAHPEKVEQTVGMILVPLTHETQEVSFPTPMESATKFVGTEYAPWAGDNSPYVTGGSSDGTTWTSICVDESWDGILSLLLSDEILYWNNSEVPWGYRVRIYRDLELVEELTLKEVKP